MYTTNAIESVNSNLRKGGRIALKPPSSLELGAYKYGRSLFEIRNTGDVLRRNATVELLFVFRKLCVKRRSPARTTMTDPSLPTSSPFMLNPSLFLVFLAIAVPTILTPGPGVLMSLTNTLRFGLARATPGIIGVALGTLVIAGLSATGLGVLLSTSHTVYNLVKIAGILFMFYLGMKRWNSPAAFLPAARHMGTRPIDEAADRNSRPLRLFFEGIVLQLSNPQLIIFYITLFPQCIDPQLSYTPQFVLLSCIYTVLVWLIHSCYGWIAERAAERFMTAKTARCINRTSAVAFWALAAWLLFSIVREFLP